MTVAIWTLSSMTTAPRNRKMSSKAMKKTTCWFAMPTNWGTYFKTIYNRLSHANIQKNSKKLMISVFSKFSLENLNKTAFFFLRSRLILLNSVLYRIKPYIRDYGSKFTRVAGKWTLWSPHKGRCIHPDSNHGGKGLDTNPLTGSARLLHCHCGGSQECLHCSGAICLLEV